MASSVRLSGTLQAQMTRLHKKDYFKEKYREELCSLVIRFQKSSFMIRQWEYSLLRQRKTSW